MSIVVEHEKRKKEILECALDVFLEEGYSGASYQKIADRCGIARTILYTYFRNKQEIFRYTIKQVTDVVEQSFAPVIVDTELPASERLSLVCSSVIAKCVEERKLFSVVLEYLLDVRRERSNPDELIRRRVIKLRMVITRLLNEGVESGEFKQIDVRGMNEAFYALVESAIVKLVIMKRDEVPEILEAIRAITGSLIKQDRGRQAQVIRGPSLKPPVAP